MPGKTAKGGGLQVEESAYGSPYTMRGHAQPGPFQQVAPKTESRDVDEATTNKTETYAARGAGPTESSPMEQKIFEKGGIKKQIIDPVKEFVGDNIEQVSDLGVLGYAGIEGMKGVGKYIASTKLGQTPANQTIIGKMFGGIGKSGPGRFVGGALTKAGPAIGAAIGAGAIYLGGKAAKGALNWASRGVRNVLVTGERKGSEEFKSQWGLTEGGDIDWKGSKGGAGRGELSRKTRKEKGIKIDFK